MSTKAVIWVLASFCLSNAFASRIVTSVLVDFILDAVPVLFPPTRISAHLCIDKDDAHRLSRRMSKHYLSHDIRTRFQGLDHRLDDNLEHRNLYVLDMNCEQAMDVLTEADSKKMFVGPVKWLLFQDARSAKNSSEEFVLDVNQNEILKTSFESFGIYPDSDVVLVRSFSDDYHEILSIYRPSPQRRVILEDRGSWSKVRGVLLKDYHPASRRRRDLRQTALKSCLVMTDPDTRNHLTDYQEKHVDPVTKANYAWVVHLANRMNATITFDTVNTWGYRSENGSWSGMIGKLQRREIDIGGTGTFLVAQRLGVVQYVQLYTQTGSRFIFKKPLLSSVRNIFTLPFQRSVWMAIGVFLFFVFGLLYLSMKWEFSRGVSGKTAEYWAQFNQSEPTLSDDLLVVLGAIAQQGYSYEPCRVPCRIVTLMLLIAALSLYASYTANIVALLQSTTDSIKTVTDLLHSPLKLAAQDVVYNRYYFKAFQDPVRRAVVDQRIEPKGKKPSWMTIEEGVRKIKEGLFAFHGEVGTVYKIIQDTYQEEEKCGLMEIDFLNVLNPLLVTQMQSPYLEIIKNGALLLRESGLKFREEYRLYTNKPMCQGQTNFISIGITECYFALVTIGYGLGLTLIVLLLEILWSKRQNSKLKDKVENIVSDDTVDEIFN